MTNEEIAERIAQGEDSRTQFKLGPIGVANSIGIPEVPEEALQEIVANMLLHRDYFTASPWKVLIFDDRIEIISPGSLPNHLTIDKIKAGVSVARNPVLFTFATKEIPYRGLGSGVKRILEIVRDIEFKSDDELNLFTVVVKRNKEREVVNDAGEVVNNTGEVVNDDSEVVKEASEVVNETVNSTNETVKLGGETVNSEIGGVNDKVVGVNGGVNVDDGPVNGLVNEGYGLVNVPINGGDVPINVPISEIDGPVNKSDGPVNAGSGPVKLLDMICKFPGKNKNILAEMTGISLRSVKRFLEEDLKGKVEFRGAPKNGGYYIKGSIEKDG